MSLTGEEIKLALTEFASKWAGFKGSEKSEAQTFLNELLACYGVERRDDGIEFEYAHEGKFHDMLWPGVCLIEMKRPSESARLSKHRKQAFDYWEALGNQQVDAPQYVVLCSFHEFEIWEPGAVRREPRVKFSLDRLPEHLDSLLFLVDREPVFLAGHLELSREAAGLVTDVARRLEERRAATLSEIQQFVLQAVWCMFAEDLQMLPGHSFTRLLDRLIDDKHSSSADVLGQLFTYLDDPGGAPEQGLYAGTPYANGGLFKSPARVHLLRDELVDLRQACDRDWTQIEPSIFGSLLEGALGHEAQWKLGAHYTAEADIMSVVRPTIIEPWRKRIEACETIAEVRAAQEDLAHYIVLDPACGSGNFLYVAYRELRRLESELRERAQELARKSGASYQEALAGFSITNMRGIEIDRFAVDLARLTLWIGHKLAIDELGLSESSLPLKDLGGIQHGDALKSDWPHADAIIGNPPFHGASHMRSVLGDEYVEWLKKEFGVGVKDHCIYWFRKAHDNLAPNGRAGLVGTNSISQNLGRGASLEYVISRGGVITSAVSTKPWTGTANVHVSIANWVKEPSREPGVKLLDGVPVTRINAELRGGTLDVSSAMRLRVNFGICFEGPSPKGEGFILVEEEAARLISIDPTLYQQVVKPYLTARDIAEDPAQAPSRWIIDFGLSRLEDAMKWPAALEIVRERVKPFRDTVNMTSRRENWWLFGSAAGNMRKAIAGLDRFLVSTKHGKRILFAWQPAGVIASNATNVFAFDDDYHVGVLMSRAHIEWARAQASTIKGDIRYTPSSCLDTFPWPAIDSTHREVISSISAELMRIRTEICTSRQIGLTTLYNQLDDGAWKDLAARHAELDIAVVDAYGWPRTIVNDTQATNRLLLDLNAARASDGVTQPAEQPFS